MLVQLQQAILRAKKRFADEFGSLDELPDGQCYTTTFADGVIVLRTVKDELHIEVIETTPEPQSSIGIFEP